MNNSPVMEKSIKDTHEYKDRNKTRKKEENYGKY